MSAEGKQEKQEKHKSPKSDPKPNAAKSAGDEQPQPLSSSSSSSSSSPASQTAVAVKSTVPTPPPTAGTAGSDDVVAEKRKTSAKRAPLAKRTRRSSASYGPLSAKYGYADGDALVQALSAPTEVFEQAATDVRRVVADSESTLDQLLALPANVTNSRLMDKVANLRERHAKILEESILAIQDLLVSAQIAEATRRTKELKDRLAAERKAAKEAAAARK